MLKTRIITALIIGPLAIAAIILLPPMGFQIFLAALLLVGSWEFSRLASLDKVTSAILLLIQTAIFAALIAHQNNYLAIPGMLADRSVLIAACIVWLIFFTRLYFYTGDKQADAGYRLLGFFTALAVITFGWFAVSWLRQQASGPWWILILFVVIWAADIGAYICGRLFGKRKLAPLISPGKTWMGLLGGVIAAPCLAILVTHFIPELTPSPLHLGITALVTALVSVGGDLFISLHKRTVGLKDTGKIFPGHGGVLDRLDSLLAGASFFALGKILLGF